MSVYDKASLVLIPSGTKTSKVYSQVPTNGDGDFTFSRSTAATRVNADGNIEKETQNLLTYSNDFNNWSKALCNVTSGQSGYDGSSDAWLLTATGSGNSCRRDVVYSGVNSFSVYAKAGTADGIRLRFDASTDRNLKVDLTDGSLISDETNLAYSIEDVSGGWYRITATSNLTTGINVRLIVTDNTGTQSTGSVYIQDAQLEQGLVARDYIETTTAAVEGGITDNVPRLDYTDSSCPALLLEPQRRNLLVQSEYLGATWSAAGGLTFTQSNAISPEGVQNASTLDFNLLQGYLYYYYSGIDYTGKKLTFSYYIKGTAGETALARNYSSASISTTLTTLNGDWQRVEHTFDGGTFNYVYPIDSRHGGTATSVQVYGMQLEDDGAGNGTSYATSYIPTYGTAASRTADYSYKSGISSLIGQTRGTFYISADSFTNSGTYWIGLGGSTTNRILVGSSGGFVRLYFQSNAGSTGITTEISSLSKFKAAVTYDGVNYNFYVNGSNVSTRSIGSFGVALDSIKTGNFVNDAQDYVGSIDQIIVFPAKLTDAECIALTTI